MMVTYPSKKKAIRAKIISKKIDNNTVGLTQGIVVPEPEAEPASWSLN